MSMPTPKAGSAGSPGCDAASNGQDRWLARQYAMKSSACAAGKMTTLPCT